MARYIPRAEFARAAGVSAPAITKACKTKLRDACQGTRIDIDHTAAVAYLANRIHQPGSAAGSDGATPKAPKPARRRDVAPTSPAPATQTGTGKPTQDHPDLDETGVGPDDAFDVTPDVSTEELTRLLRVLRPIVHRYGTRYGFESWLDRVKTLEDIRKKRLDNDATEGRLISDEIVKTHIIGAMEGSHRRLLGDTPKTIARLLFAMAHSKETIEDAEARVRSVISAVLKTAQTSAMKALSE
jgi:hypothetical protein